MNIHTKILPSCSRKLYKYIYFIFTYIYMHKTTDTTTKCNYIYKYITQNDMIMMITYYTYISRVVGKKNDKATSQTIQYSFNINFSGVCEEMCACVCH